MPRAAPLVGGQPMAPPTAGQSWFAGAPLSKLWTVTTVVFYILFRAKLAQDAVAMDSLRMLRASQYGASGVSSEWYRYGSSKMTFGSTGEMVVGGMLIAVLSRQFEREMGTRKFAVFLAAVTVGAIAMEILYVAFSAGSMYGYRYQGPYASLGALMYLYHRYTPRLHPRFIGVLGFNFSEKSLYYIWFVHIIGYGGVSTVVASIFGIVAAYAFMITNLHQSVDIPDAIAKPLTAVGARVSEPPPRILAPIGNRGRDVMEGMQRFARNAAVAAATAQRPVAPPTPAPPDPSAVEQLTSMGFERNRVVEALQVSNNNVERAANHLLSG